MCVCVCVYVCVCLHTHTFLCIISQLYWLVKHIGQIINPNTITLVICFNKQFASILNNILTANVDKYNILSKFHARCRKGYSTNEQVILIYTIVELLRIQK